MERTGLKASEPTHFTVDCTDAGEGKSRLGCSVVSESQVMQGGDNVLFHAGFPYQWKNLGGRTLQRIVI